MQVISGPQNLVRLSKHAVVGSIPFNAASRTRKYRGPQQGDQQLRQMRPRIEHTLAIVAVVELAAGRCPREKHHGAGKT